MSKLYLLATNTKKVISHLITGVTGERFNHASVALDPSLRECYSFSMGAGGFVVENPSVWPSGTEFLLHEVEVTPAGLRAARSRIEKEAAGERGFSYTGMLGVVLRRPIESDDALFCSEFVERVCVAAGLAPSVANPALATPVGVVARADSKKIASGMLHRYIAAHQVERNFPMILRTETAEYEMGALTEGVLGDWSKNISDLSKSSIDAAVSSWEKKVAESEAGLAKGGFDMARFRAHCEKEASRLERIFAPTGGFRESVGENAAPTFQKLSKEVSLSFSTVFRSMYDDLGEEGEIPAGLAMFMVILAAQIIVAPIGFLLLGPWGGQVFLAVVAAPLTEELGRRLLIKQGKGLAAYTLTINVFEFLTYTRTMLAMGYSLGSAVLIRGTVAVIHQLLGALQKWGYIRDLQMGVSPEKAGEKEFYLAILAHSLYNLFSTPIWDAIVPPPVRESASDEYFATSLELAI
jgi:hypothetical protein